MERFKNYVWMAAGFVILAAAISAFVPNSALAQIVKAALVKNVDEPGRNFLTIEFDNTTGHTNYTVPAGKILVIEQVMTNSGSAVGSYQCLSFNGSFVQGTDSTRWGVCFGKNSSGYLYERVRLYAKGGQKIDYTALGTPPQLFAQGYLIDAN